MTDLSGKVAVVTGGTRGIGASIARRLALDGAHVAFTFVHQTKASNDIVGDIVKQGRQGFAVQLDAADAMAIRPSIDRIVGRFGRLDILVNNAGYMSMSGSPLSDIPLEIVNHTIMLNIRAAFIFAQAVSPHLGTGGRIINIGSCLSSRVPCAGLTLYAMSKSAMTGLTKGLARDLASQGVTVNQISPGPIDTDMNPANGPTSALQRGLTAFGRYGEPTDIAATASFLASDEAAFITGADIVVDGGTNI
ncbi:SDR family oxidoreductase [Verminephrobacter aporrectodeae subsp. tuberculatae]|uniref:SDR family NAD(P)-dependent oxidoreductase n=1 Tax=Verminephrobacter aporrectodeae TaxID=1110389 RepID=UPI0022446D7A|nr:SDR family oxidoreductase [Verminephrobacter aporrectodeae]MCW8167273.1 SDR family oxidoreductase [Verminephrobacter aporrectodeae subsp. tuberculatae]MCW8171519.1 SDR family oxidoreductase [Verminephrobacter aporrectodeae subsp. tuberculatae]MCW8209483.1 SDR family oxidoreductase [Verminephrobacter aporrectodeae subsp. tuberculatae]